MEVNKDSALLKAKYKTDQFLQFACAAIKRNFNINVEIIETDWMTASDGTPCFMIIYKTSEHADREIEIVIVGGIFMDESRRGDAEIGASKLKTQSAKIIVRLARVLYNHRND